MTGVGLLWLAVGGLTGTAHGADDAFGRPEHLRAAVQAPADWGALDPARQAVRLWWDAGPSRADVQVEDARGWRTVAEDVAPGWVSARVSVGTRFRVRLGEGRWSEPVSAPAWTSPAQLAAMAGPPGSSLAGVVGQLSSAGPGGGAWASTIGGGVLRLRAGQPAERLGAWEGLPDDRALAVSAFEDRVLVGTAAGAALVQDGVVSRVFDAELPNPYVQAVLVDGGGLWIGTYKGLVRVDARGASTVLEPWSVFSLTAVAGGGAWVGYEGLRRLDPSGAQVAGPWLEDDRVYGAWTDGDAVVAASLESGVMALSGSDARPLRASAYPPQDAYGVVLGAGGLWVAAGGMGLFGPAQQSWGRAEGLPSDTVWSVAAEPGGGLWVGTDRGAALVWTLPARERQDAKGAARGLTNSPDTPRTVRPVPISRWPADGAAWDLLERKNGAWIAGPEGVRAVGQPHRHAADLVAASGDRVHALVAHDDGVWSLGRAAIRLDRRGRLHPVELPATALTGASWNGELWVGGPDGVWRYDPLADRFSAVSPLPEVSRLVVGPQGLWAVARGSVFRLVSGGVRPFLRTRQALDVAPAARTVWVGTVDGLERIVLEGEGFGDVVDVLGEGDAGVAIPAVAVDDAGGCWFAAEDGTVGRVNLAGETASVRLPQPDPPRPRRVIPDGPDAAWVLTDAGTWRVRLAL